MGTYCYVCRRLGGARRFGAHRGRHIVAAPRTACLEWSLENKPEVLAVMPSAVSLVAAIQAAEIDWFSGGLLPT